MKYVFSVNIDSVDGDVFKVVEVESNSLTNAIKMLAFEAFRLFGGSNFMLCPFYVCFSGKGRSDRKLTASNLDFFKKCYRDVNDVSVIIY